jgi:hypothetical protein
MTNEPNTNPSDGRPEESTRQPLPPPNTPKPSWLRGLVDDYGIIAVVVVAVTAAFVVVLALLLLVGNCIGWTMRHVG